MSLSNHGLCTKWYRNVTYYSSSTCKEHVTLDLCERTRGDCCDGFPCDRLQADCWHSKCSLKRGRSHRHGWSRISVNEKRPI